MEKTIITFSANEQHLIKTGGIECYASNIVSYIEAHFDLGANWSGYDSVRAVWSNDNNMTTISTVLDADGVCIVPFEVLKTKGVVKVNLVGSISVSDVLDVLEVLFVLLATTNVAIIMIVIKRMV